MLRGGASAGTVYVVYRYLLGLLVLGIGMDHRQAFVGHPDHFTHKSYIQADPAAVIVGLEWLLQPESVGGPVPDQDLGLAVSCERTSSLSSIMLTSKCVHLQVAML